MDIKKRPAKLTPKGTPPMPGKTRKPRPGRNRTAKHYDSATKTWTR